MNNETFASRIRKAADGIGGQAELSRRSGISKMSIGTYVSGKSEPSRDRLVSIAVATEVSVAWLATGEGSMNGTEELPGADPGDFDYIPLAETKLSAGGGAFVTTESISDHYAFKTEWLRKTLLNQKHAVLMNVIENSMEPTIKEGDVVMLDPGRTHINDGKVYALRMDNTIMIKRLSLRPGDKIQVISDNRAEYDSYVADREDIIVIAQVVWFARALVKPE